MNTIPFTKIAATQNPMALLRCLLSARLAAQSFRHSQETRDWTARLPLAPVICGCRKFRRKRSRRPQSENRRDQYSHPAIPMDLARSTEEKALAKASPKAIKIRPKTTGKTSAPLDGLVTAEL